MQPKQSRINQKSLVLKHKASSVRLFPVWTVYIWRWKEVGDVPLTVSGHRKGTVWRWEKQQAAENTIIQHLVSRLSAKLIHIPAYSDWGLNRMSNSQSVFCVYCNVYTPETKLIYILTCICSEKALKVHFQSKEQFYCSQIFNSKCLMQLKNLVKDNQYINI